MLKNLQPLKKKLKPLWEGVTTIGILIGIVAYVYYFLVFSHRYETIKIEECTARGSSYAECKMLRELEKKD